MAMRLALIVLVLLISMSPSTAHARPQKNPQRLWGVNWNGGEFGGSTWPGVLNTNYIYPADVSRGEYFLSKGLTLVRLPFDWERVQNQALGPLSSADIAGITRVLSVAQQSHQLVILDMHNFGRYYGNPLDPVYDAPKLADVWRKLAQTFRGHPALYGYELMNEPHDLKNGGDGWEQLAQAATNAIREVDTSSVILVPGYSWQTARFWPDNNANLNIHDPANRLVYAAHQYFDGDYSGTYNKTYDADGATPTLGAERVQPFLKWLKDHHARGMLTEYGVPGDDPRWLTVLDNFYSALEASPEMIGGTYWGAGPWWGDYPLSVEPKDGQDRPQMAILSKYPSGDKRR